MTFTTPAIRREIITLAKGRTPPREILAQLRPRAELNSYIIYNVLSRARANGEDIPPFPTQRGGSVPPKRAIAKDVARLIEVAAACRHCTPAELRARIVETVMREGLLTAVLDDRSDAA